ncbi:MAG TPA: hypothetical protein VHV78_01055 [Gemmatimonadaceae bacterium]|jgi:hypothetical protein|nr:hypothetical protein [Gemmatimonadaceae bacterium]
MPNTHPVPHAALVRRAVGALIAATLIAIVTVTAAADAQVRITMRAWQEPVLLDTMRQDHHLSASADKVYSAALQAYADLGIPTGKTDGKSGIVGSERFEQARSLANAPMSRWFSCGEGATGPYADSFRLEIAVVTWVEPEGTGTKVGLATIASGRDVSGVFRNPKECESTGALELEILGEIKKLVGS